MRTYCRKLIKGIVCRCSPAKLPNTVVIIFLFCCLFSVGGYLVLHAQVGISPREALPQSKSTVVPSGHLSREQSVISSAEDVEELLHIEDASSEKKGKWFGLCKKRSIHSIKDFRRTVENDPVLSEYYAGFNWEEAKLGNLEQDVLAYVAHRKGAIIRQTAKPITLPKGDGYITDGVRTARTYCCNDIVITPSAGNPPAASVIPPGKTSILSPGVNPPAVTRHADFPRLDIPYGSTLGRFSDIDQPLGTLLPLGEGVPVTTQMATLPSPPSSSVPVPEPDSFLLVGIGLLFLTAMRRKP